MARQLRYSSDHRRPPLKPVLTFDLNGTLTDFSSLDPFFANLFGSAEERR